jgi:hypothetical protein
MILWHCYRCGHDRAPEQFYCTTSPQLDAPAWWCKLCVAAYHRARALGKKAAA